MNEFFNGDCLAVLPTLEAGSVDMVLADLPYGATRNKWDDVVSLGDLWLELKRVMRPGGAAVFTAIQPFTSRLVLSNESDFHQALVWEKNVASDFFNANRRHLSRHEDVLVFCARGPVYRPQFGVGKAYVARRSGRSDTGANYDPFTTGRSDTVNEGRRFPTSILQFSREVGLHPTQKPVALGEYLIRTYTNPGETVLDPTMGSGSFGVAAINTGRRFVGIERDPDYFATAKARIEAAAASANTTPEPDLLSLMTQAAG